MESRSHPPSSILHPRLPCFTASPARAKRKFIYRPSPTHWNKARRHRARAGDLADAADGGTIQGAVQFREITTLVAVLHSHLSAGERHDEWHKIRRARTDRDWCAFGDLRASEPLDPSSWTRNTSTPYKQGEAPLSRLRCRHRAGRWKARWSCSVWPPVDGELLQLQGGKYTLLDMPERVDNQKMPIVRVVDMRQPPAKKGHR